MKESTIRLAEIQDKNAIIYLYSVCGAIVNRDELDSSVNRHQVLIAKVDGALVGSLTMHENKMKDLVVAMGHRRQRIGTALVATWAIVGGLCGYGEIAIETDAHIVPFLKSLGFKQSPTKSTLWIRSLINEGLSPFYERVPDTTLIDIKDSSLYREVFKTYFKKSVDEKEHERAHFIRITREEALQFLEVCARNDPQERRWIFREPMVPNDLSGLVDPETG